MSWTGEQLQEFYRQRAEQATAPLVPPEKPAKVKTPRPRQNKWEREYDAKLRAMYGRGEIQWYEFEGMTLRLADDTRYTPDFAVMHNDGHVEMVEVKGFIREDALVKFKVAAERFPFEFCMYRKQKVSEGGGWDLIKAIQGGKR